MDKVRKAWLDKRRELGLCLQCGKKAGPKSKVYCSACSLMFRENSKHRHNKLREKGLCTQCMKRNTTTAKICKGCKKKNNLERNKKTLQREESGVCVLCGKLEPVHLNRKCLICCLKNSAWNYFHETKKWIELQELFNKQKGICPYTGRQLIVGLNAEIDHILPRSQGGSNDISNLQWVYCDVNRMKAHQRPEDFLNLVREIFLYQKL